MNKSDLKDGMTLVYKNGNRVDYYKGHLLDFESEGIRKMDVFNEDLTHKEHDFWDVCKIIQDDSIVWEREEVDWSKISKDTKVLVSNGERDDIDFEDSFVRRYFAKYKNGIFYTYAQGTDSWTNESYCYNLVSWDYCKLVEEPKENITVEDLESIIDNCDCNGCLPELEDYNCSRCKAELILDNYIMIRK